MRRARIVCSGFFFLCVRRNGDGQRTQGRGGRTNGRTDGRGEGEKWGTMCSDVCWGRGGGSEKKHHYCYWMKPEYESCVPLAAGLKANSDTLTY